MDWSRVRKQFPVTEEYTYFDLANKCGLPNFVVKSIEKYIGKQQRSSGSKDEWFNTLEEARSNLAILINSATDELAFTKNTSEGLNIAANCLPLDRGDTVLLNEYEHPNNIYCWLNLENKGIKTKWIPSDNGIITIDNIKKVMDKSVKAISFSSVTFAPGNRNNVKEIVDYCKENKVFTVVDAVQSIGTTVVDVKDWGAVIVCTGAHKSLFTPHGVGVMYIRKEILDQIHPLYVARAGMGMAAQVKNKVIEYKLDQANNARKFEIGNYNYLGITALNESLKFLLDIGMDNVEARILEIYDYLVTELLKLNVEILSPISGVERSAILCFQTARTEELHKYLISNNVINTLRRNMIRISIGLYNNKEDVDSLIEGIKSFI